MFILLFVEQVIYFDYELFVNKSNWMFGNDTVRHTLMPGLSLWHSLANSDTCSLEFSRVLEYYSPYSEAINPS